MHALRSSPGNAQCMWETGPGKSLLRAMTRRCRVEFRPGMIMLRPPAITLRSAVMDLGQHAGGYIAGNIIGRKVLHSVFET